MASKGTVGVVGTGIMGAPMAVNLAKAGYDVVAYNRTPAKAEALTGDGLGEEGTQALVKAVERPAGLEARQRVSG